MMIRVLHPHIANQIAAGEVVEQPASVVKELLENALDANATAITIEVDGGGITYIRVTDNGEGIAGNECALAFERHATSKINSKEDLSHIETLGFRGEALASIAAIACVELRSKRADGEGMRVRIEGGKNKLVEPVACPNGTTITVESLFFNVPARRKFLKSPRSEQAYIGDYISRMILARPDVAFKYINSQKNVYHSPGDGNLRNAVFCVYGQDVLEHLRAVEYDDGYIRANGYIGSPEIARPNRNWQSFFLNGRFIHSSQISSAIMRAYDTLLMGKKYPFAVLSLTISSREVDVNVHPTKLEARFAQEGRVMESISRACAQALNVQHIPDARLYQSERKHVDIPAKSATNDELTADTEYSKAAAEPVFIERDDLKPLSFRVKESEHRIPQYSIETAPPIQMIDDAQDKEETIEQQSLGDVPPSIIGSAFNTYWILQHGEALYIIDQHAAHERLLYERFMAANEQTQAQALLIPEIVNLSGGEYSVFEQYGYELRALGFEIEEFGAACVRVFAVPSALMGANAADVLRGALDSISRLGKTSTKELRRDAIIQAACKHAIKAGDPLAEEAMLDILNQFLKDGTPMTCPHGRPVIIRLSRKELEKLFKRIV